MTTIIITGKIQTMKNSIILGISFILFISGCHNVQIKEVVTVPKAIVEAVTFKSGAISDEISLQSQSSYLIKSGITAPINSYVQKTYIMQGDRVQVGQILYEIVTKERRAIEQSALKDTIYHNLGIIKIKANSAGIVSTMLSQTGDYVTEGTQMCQISSVSSLIFTLQVPYEYNSLLRTGSSCSIALPDGRTIQGIVKNELDQMSLNGQTRQYIVKPQTEIFIPENLLATVTIKTRTSNSKHILPIACVLTDEMMQKNWVMKLINDTTAIKINVTTGLKNKNEVEILAPKFSVSDRILSSGNYGLSDTALVNVEKH